jgi:uridine kinase
MTKRRSLLREVGLQLARLAPDRIVRIAIDGVDGAGKTAFADELAEMMRDTQRPVIRASVDGFHNPRAVRYRCGRTSPQGFFEDSYDYAALRTYLLDPLGPAGSRRYRLRVFDHVTDMPVPVVEQEAAATSILLLDGIFLHREELASYWNASIFLQVDFPVSVGRCAQRDGSSADPAAMENRRYVEGQGLYLRSCDPARRATLTIDNSNLFEPVVISKR